MRKFLPIELLIIQQNSDKEEYLIKTFGKIKASFSSNEFE
jgi:hypothetical protein